LTHGAWWDLLRKENRVEMGAYLVPIASAIQVPQVIQADPLDAVTLLYYSEPSDARGKLLCVAVKCLPRRFKDGQAQRRRDLAGRVLRRPWGEAWVSSAYFLRNPKSRGVRVWP